MSKKLIALILILPMILMITLYTAVSTVSLKVNVPVSKIEIMGDKFVSLNLDKQERYHVDYVVYPTTAANKNVVFSVEQVGSQPKAELEYKNGYIYPKSAGSAYACFSTADGGYRAKFHVVVKATQLKEISCSMQKTTLTIGEKVQIDTLFTPQTASNKNLEYFSSNTNVLSVDDNGLVTAKGKGSATITICSLADQTIYDTIDVLVNAQEILSISDTEITTWEETGEIILTVDTAEQYSINSLKYKVVDEYGNDLDGVIEPANQNAFTEIEEDVFAFNYKFVNQNFVGKAVIVFTLITNSKTEYKTCTINMVEELTAEFKSQDPLCVQVDEYISWKNQIAISPSGANVSYSVNYSNANLSKEGSFSAIACKMGYTKANIVITSSKYPNQVVELQKDVYVCPDTLSIEQSIDEFGIENVWTIGATDVYDNKVSHQLTLSFEEKTKGADFDKLEQKIKFETSQSEKVKVNGKNIEILDQNFNGIVQIKAKLDLPNDMQSEKIDVRCVGNGVEVSNFSDLYKATKLNKPIVLQADIINDFGEGVNSFEKIPSTFDTRFYGSAKPEVITLLQFKSNLYGNGYTINANKITSIEHDAFDNKAVFNGPLDFVSMANYASVKAQDNICFAVFENVTINNVQLMGITLQEDELKQVDLTDLDYAGTVVEVLGDNVNIEYSRISNGRTVLRAFGDINDSTKVINVNIKNCELRYAREFIVRMGSNCIKNDDRPLNEVDLSNYQAPNLYETDNFNFPVQRDYDKLNVQEYQSNYIKTFVTIENSVLRESGIFAIGIDTHFAGPMLYNAWETNVIYNGYASLANWKGLSGTSYGAKLTLCGDVRIYDWKEIDKIDSSTLIEKGINADTLGGLLNFDLNEMIKVYNSNTAIDTSMIYNGKYVHGGIVLFGGGKNYGIVEDKSQNFTNIPNFDNANIKFNEYCIALRDVGQAKLEEAAGNNPFYFMIYGNNSNFNYDDQMAIINGGYADNCIYF